MTFLGRPTWIDTRRAKQVESKTEGDAGEDERDPNLQLPHRGNNDPYYIGDIYDTAPTKAENEWSEALKP